MVYQYLKSFILKVVGLGTIVLVLSEVNHHKVYNFVPQNPFSEILYMFMGWTEKTYYPYRIIALKSNGYLFLPNIVLFGIVLMIVSSCLFVLIRKLLIFFNKHRAEIVGLNFHPQKFDFRFESFRPEQYFFNKPKNSVFLGLDRNQKPFFLEERQRSTHIQIIGRTGSGKSKLLETMILQDIREGKGVIFIDGKGDLETKEKFCGMATSARRKEDVLIFDLVKQNDSWIYNPVFMRADSNPTIIAEKMLSTFPCETEFYRHVQQNIFTILLQIAHAKGMKITLKNLHFAMRRIENLRAFSKHCPDENLIVELEDFLHVNNKDYLKNVIGIVAWLQKYSLIDQINRDDGAPEIDFQNVFKHGKLVYFRLPAGYSQTSAKDIGHVVLQDLQFMAGLRQVLPNQSHHPFSIYVDEFAVFADETFIQAINKARSANIWWTIAHQSFSDLNAISPAFAEGVWDNTRTKIILSQRNAELCEKISSELGTFQRIERTERIAEGAFLTRKEMGDASTKMVDEYVLHPNFIKNLHPYGQGYVVGENLRNKESFVGLNFGQIHCPRVSIQPRNVRTVKNIGGIK